MLGHDLRVVWRHAVRRPGFAAATALTFALGLGATTALFSVVYGVLLRPLPYDEPDELVALWPTQAMSHAEMLHLRDRATTLSGIASVAGWAVALTATDEPTQLRVEKTTANVFEVVGARAFLGRTFEAGEDRPGNDRVAVISHPFWRERFGGDRRVLGRTIVLDGNPYEIVGVMPPGFQLFGTGVELWIPLPIDANAWWYRSSVSRLVARLAPDCSLAGAKQEFASLVDSLRATFEYPEGYGRTADVLPLREAIVGEIEPMLLVFSVAAGLILLIAVANVGTLLVAAAVERTREMAIRTALGAGRARLVRQPLIESVAMAIGGGLIGMLVAWWGVRALVPMLPAETPRVEQIGVDLRIFSIGLIGSALVGLLVGTLPAAAIWRGDVQPLLRAGAVDRAAGRGGTLRDALVMMEVALALVLLIGAGVMLQTIAGLRGVDLGFHPEGVLTLRVQPVGGREGADARQRAFYASAFERIDALPGVVAAGAAQHLPLSGWEWGADLTIEGQPLAAGATPPRAGWRLVAHDYFRAIGVPLLHGRLFSDRDGPDTPRVAIVNEAAARRLWGTAEAALGRRLSAGAATGNDWATIVGVVGDVRHRSVDREPALELYRPYAQMSSMPALMLAVRTEGDPLALAAAVRDAIWSVDPGVPVSHVQPMARLVSASIARPEAVALLLAALALVGLALGLVGVYGVVAYRVGRRTREIGLRLALGARPAAVVAMIVSRGLASGAAGAAIGLAAALVLARGLESLVFGISPTDPPTFAALAALLLLVVGLASAIAARRAGRIDPAVALREE